VAQETEQSKRARQKQRREEKLARERAAAAKARRNRLVAFAGAGLVVLLVAGLLIGQQVQRRNAEQANIAAAEARLDDLGCTPIEAEEQTGAGNHIPDAQLAQSPPEVLYPERPAASGTHYGSWALTGVYDEQVDERILVHNLEHGYVNFYYDDDADPAQVEQLRTFAQEQIDGRFPKIVVAPFGEALPDEANFATVAWGQRQLCQTFDTGVAASFLTQHHNGEDAPERFLPPHRNEGEGLDPASADGPLLLPPLGQPAEATTEDAPSTDSTLSPEQAEETPVEELTAEPSPGG
jgi:hypothetical protein